MRRLASRSIFFEKNGYPDPEWVLLSDAWVYRSFRDDRHGGTARALKQAVTFRDQHVRAAFVGGTLNAKAVSARSRSGVVGVTLKRFHRRDREWLFWSASWNAHGRNHRKRFSVLGYGYQGAFELACRTRTEMTGLPIIAPRAPARDRAVRRRAEHRRRLIQR